MLIVLVILSVGLLGLVIYFAVSRKSSRFLKLAAFIALGLIALALVVAGIFLIVGPGESVEHLPIPLFQETPAPERESNVIMEAAAFLLFFLLIIGLIYYLTHREQRRRNGAAKKSPPPRQ